jgi:hypothetical protein
MKSAYGRQTSAPDYELTCVELGSPMGELMRRYWQPVCTSRASRCPELTAAGGTERVRILLATVASLVRTRFPRSGWRKLAERVQARLEQQS